MRFVQISNSINKIVINFDQQKYLDFFASDFIINLTIESNPNKYRKTYNLP